MRPRHKAAENDLDKLVDAMLADASMRPRHKAAENIAARIEANRVIFCFNEAAA